MVEKVFRVLIFMTFYTIFFRLFGRYSPCMFFVAIKTFQIHAVYMQVVFPYTRDSAVTFCKTVIRVRLQFLVRVMAFIADELHRGILRNSDLYRLLDRLLRRLVIFDIDRAVGDQFLPDRLATVTIETFLPARQKIFVRSV